MHDGSPHCKLHASRTLWADTSVLAQSMRMLLSFGARRHMVHAAPEPSYEAMLALDENNPRRGVKRQILEQLPQVGILLLAAATMILPIPSVMCFHKRGT